MAIDINEPAMVAAKSIPTKSKLSNNDWWILGGLGLVAGGVAIYYWKYYLPKKGKMKQTKAVFIAGRDPPTIKF